MKNKIDFKSGEFMVINAMLSKLSRQRVHQMPNDRNRLPEILFITSYPPRECGIATYSHDLLKALKNKFAHTFSLKVCALESEQMNYIYPDEVKYVLNTNDASKYIDLAHVINDSEDIKLVLVQHEFGFFQDNGGNTFLQFLYGLTKPAVTVFHTVLPYPDELLKVNVQRIAAACESVVVMTQSAAQILSDKYGVMSDKIVVIPHGTHLVPSLDKEALKTKYSLTGRKVLSTFGLLSSGKSIETTLKALPAIIKINPEVTFLVLGKTHPGVVKSEGEKYRNSLERMVEELELQAHVKFINRYLPLEDLLEYLQMSDIYLFTSKDPDQAVSGTFSYAMSCGCPIISTRIPHAIEVLRDNTGILIDFQDSEQLAEGVSRLLNDQALRTSLSTNTLHRMASTAWENSAIMHALLLQKTTQITFGAEVPALSEKMELHYRMPSVSLEHIKKMTTDFGMIQFSKINQPDLESGYTLDDNARAMIAVCMHYELTGDQSDLLLICSYLEFIKFCQQPAGAFLNYVDSEQRFTGQNQETNLSDANGRALWALGYLISRRALLPAALITTAEIIMKRALTKVEEMHSTRAMAFAIKGLYYYNLEKKSGAHSDLIKMLADRMVQMYRHESSPDWQWYESYLTYGNCILPEAMLCAWRDTGEPVYKEIALASFDFLLSRTFNKDGIKVISNKTWLKRGEESAAFGEQPIDVAYTILALRRFYRVFQKEDYSHKLTTAFNWFLGHNHLHQIIYNPCTGGCYDGLEEHSVNLNQGAESTVSYLMARMTMQKHLNSGAH